MASSKHQESLLERHEKLMPCSDCKLKELCKYAFIGHVDLPLDVFEVTVSCRHKQPVFDYIHRTIEEG